MCPWEIDLYDIISCFFDFLPKNLIVYFFDRQQQYGKLEVIVSTQFHWIYFCFSALKWEKKIRTILRDEHFKRLKVLCLNFVCRFSVFFWKFRLLRLKWPFFSSSSFFGHKDFLHFSHYSHYTNYGGSLKKEKKHNSNTQNAIISHTVYYHFHRINRSFSWSPQIGVPCLHRNFFFLKKKPENEEANW